MERRQLTVGIVSLYDPHSDKKAQSGILYKINESLENAGFKTIWVKTTKTPVFKFVLFFFRAWHFITKRITYLDRTYIGAYLLSQHIDKKAIEKSDILMFIHNQHILYAIHTSKPIIYHSDATFELANNYYMHNMYRWNAKQGERMEQIALNKVKYHLSSSDWRQRSVINHYKIDSTLCEVLEYGPCIDKIEFKRTYENKKCLNLLFIGVDWIRKGGKIAVETTNILNKMGIKTQLTIAGLKKIPSECINNPYINFKGYLNKNIKEQYEKLNQLYKEADIFFLPTLAECSAIVFCESAMWKLPVITYDTGGIANYVINDVNGYRLPLTATSNDFAEKIKEINNQNKLLKLSDGAQMISETKLNWNNWTNSFKKILENELNK